MKKLLLFFIILNFSLRGQVCTTMVAYDYIEDYNWVGLWWLGANSNYYTNASVSPTASAVQYGVGSGSSAIESDWYVLPNITGLNPSYTYVFQFRLGSYRFTNPSAATAGVDNPDYVEVQLSTDGEITYVPEMRIRGNSNSYWDYNTNATASKTANGTNTIYTPVGGGNRTSAGDGYSIIKLELSPGTTQCAVDIFCRSNSAGEEWWIDNVELIQIAPCIPLPIEILSFDVYKKDGHNYINWVTLTELNNDYFSLERSDDGFSWSEIYRVNGFESSSTPILYEYKDYTFYRNSLNYYRLKQTDLDGTYKFFEIKYVDNQERGNSDLIKITNLMGQEVSEDYDGIIIKYYRNGKIEKVFKVKNN